MLRSLLYVSHSTLTVPGDEWQVDDIVAVARSRNRELGVTGALMFTEAHFAQVLEGPSAAIDELMTSIRRDDRHYGVKVVEDIELSERRFDGWTLAYSGPSRFLVNMIELLAGEGEPDQHQVKRLIATMLEFAK